MTDTQRAPQPPDIGRRTLTPFGYAACVVVPILLAALGLTILHFNYDKEDLVAGTRIPIFTSEWQPGDDAGDARIQGVLTLVGNCVVLTAADGSTITPVWPAGYEATVQRVGAADQVKVYDPDRELVARGEQPVDVSGSYGDLGDYANRPCAPDSGELAFIQSEVTVAGGTSTP